MFTMSEEEKKTELSDQAVENVSGGVLPYHNRPDPFTPPPKREPDRRHQDQDA